MMSLDRLLAPLPGDVPQGIDLRNPSRHPALYDASVALRTARQRDINADPTAPADWAAVERLTAAVLIEYSKDLEVAAWLAEALVHIDDFEGLATGGALIARLIEQDWPVLFPAPDPEEPEDTPDLVRLRALDRVADRDGSLLPAVRRVVLFTLDDGTGFTQIDCQGSKTWTALKPDARAKRLAEMPPARRAAMEQAAETKLWDQVRQSAVASCADTLAVHARGIAAAQAAWRGVTAAVGARPGGERFISEPLLTLLDDVLRTVTELLPADAVGAEPPVADIVADQPAMAVAAPMARRLETRDDAMRQLEEITAFFRRTEPYSPLAYTLEEAMRRARLSWPELLQEVVPDRQQREMILLRFGINPTAGAG